MQRNSIHVTGATGKTGGRVANVLWFAESNALFQVSSGSQTAV